MGLRPATRDEFKRFLRAYPRKLRRDRKYFCTPVMDVWHDFELAPGCPFKSIVAMASRDDLYVKSQRMELQILDADPS